MKNLLKKSKLLILSFLLPTSLLFSATVEITNLAELQAINDGLSGDYELANDIDSSATENWNELIDAGAWDDSTEYSLVANTSHDRVTHGGSAYYCIATNTDVEPGVDAGWEDYWVLTTLDVGHCLGFEPIGTSAASFTGTFDGQGYTIDGLYINRAGDIGLFGYVFKSTMAVHSIGLTNVTVIGSGSNIGALFGVLYAPAENVYATGSVTTTGATNTGGVAGLVFQTQGQISNSWANVMVTTDTDARNRGGFAGRATQGVSIINCYSIGQVLPTGGTGSGGFVGSIGTMIDTNNFWDTETSGQATSAMGTGKTTAEMKDYDTFNDASWDIVLKANHDGEEATAVWYIDDGVDYPRLWFEWTGTTVKQMLGRPLGADGFLRGMMGE
jgi:hypothetical protein